MAVFTLFTEDLLNLKLILKLTRGVSKYSDSIINKESE